MGFDIKRLNGINLTWIVYPIAILATGLYALINLYNFVTRNQPATPMLIILAIAFALVTAGFIYLATKKIRLNFKLSFLSVVGMILIIVFVRGIIEYIFRGHSFSDFLLIGSDHWLFPIAFGFFYLCDLSKIPKKFWFFLLPFAFFAFFLGNAILIGNSIADRNIFQSINAPNFPFLFFGVNNWEEMHTISSQQLWNGFIDGFLQEFLTFFTLFPIVIIYYLLRKEKEISFTKNPSK